MSLLSVFCIGTQYLIHGEFSVALGEVNWEGLVAWGWAGGLVSEWWGIGLCIILLWWLLLIIIISIIVVAMLVLHFVSIIKLSLSQTINFTLFLTLLILVERVNHWMVFGCLLRLSHNTPACPTPFLYPGHDIVMI